MSKESDNIRLIIIYFSDKIILNVFLIECMYFEEKLDPWKGVTIYRFQPIKFSKYILTWFYIDLAVCLNEGREGTSLMLQELLTADQLQAEVFI